jgi:PAS domain S-box-containing protein
MSQGGDVEGEGRVVGPETGRRKRLVLLACLASFAVILAIDSVTYVGLAVGVLYIIPTGLTIYSMDERITYVVTIASSALSITGFFISPPGDVSTGVFNRSVSLVVIWAVAALTIQRMRAEESIERSNEALRDANEHLEARVEERTRELRESRERLDDAQRIGHIGCWEWDIGTGEQRWSGEQYRIFGLDPEKFVPTTRNFIDYIHPDDRDFVSEIIERIKSGETQVSYEFRVVAADGSVRLLSAMGEVTEFSEDGKPLVMVGMNQDITERKAMEDELRRSNIELQQFAYVASHDLQEPLRMVISYLDLLENRYENKVLDEKAKGYMHFAVDGARRMSTMIDDLLAYSRVGSRAEPKSPVDMNGVFAIVLKDLNVAINESGAIVTSDPLSTVMADKAQMVLLLENLISNAIKFHGESRPRVEVSSIDFGNYLVFYVRDNGIGVDPKFADKLFKMFSRLHTREEYEGTGMGLAIAKKIVERHGGRIWFESEPGKGTTFFFTLPA